MIRILTQKRLDRILKRAYEKGLSIGYDIGFQARQIDERNRGTIISSYDMDRDIREIQRKKAVEK